MKRFIEEADRGQLTLLPATLDDYIGESNPLRAIKAFVANLDLAELGSEVGAEATGRPGYHLSILLRLYIYGYLNRISSSRCLEREARRNFEVIWLLGRLAHDDKVIATASFDRTAHSRLAKCVRASPNFYNCIEDLSRPPKPLAKRARSLPPLRTAHAGSSVDRDTIMQYVLIVASVLFIGTATVEAAVPENIGVLACTIGRIIDAPSPETRSAVRLVK